MIKRLFAAALALLMLCGLLPLDTFAEDAAEGTLLPYVTWQGATPLEPGVPVRFALESFSSDLSASQVWAAVTVPEDNQAFRLDFSSVTRGTNAYVYSGATLNETAPTAKNRLLSFGAFSGSASYCCKVDYAGVYYVLLTPSASGNTYSGEASLTVSILDGDLNEDLDPEGNNDVWSRATELTQNVNTYFNLNGSNDTDWFKLTTTVPGEAVKIILSNFNYTANPVHLYLYSAENAPTGKKPLLNKSEINRDGSFSYKVNEPGDFYLCIVPQKANQFVERTLKVRYETVGPDEYELNDTWQTAAAIPQDDFEMAFTLNGENDQDWFWFETAEVNDVVNFSIRGFETDYSNRIRFAVYDIDEASGEETRLDYNYDISSVSAARRTVQLEKPGKHYVMIELYGETPIENTLLFKKSSRTVAIDGGEPNDTWQEAVPIYENVPQVFNLPASTDVDWFRFTVDDPDQTVEFTFTIPAGGNMYADLYSGAELERVPDADQMEDFFWSGNSGSGVKTARWMLGEAGDYYLRLSPRSDSVFEADASVSYALIPPDANERNNDWKTATPLNEGVASVFTLPADNDADWFKVTADEPDQTVEFTLTIPAGGNVYADLYSGADFEAEGDSANRMEDFFWSGYSGSGVKTIRWMLGEEGDYYLCIEARSDSLIDRDATVTYRLLKPDANERNNTWDTATLLPAQQNIFYTLPASNDDDWFKVDGVTPGDRITVCMNGVPAGEDRLYCDILWMTEYETSAEHCSSDWFWHSEGGSYSRTFTVEEEGDHFIRIGLGSWSDKVMTLRYAIARDDVDIQAVGVSSIGNAPTTIYQGKTLGLYAVITPANASNQNVSWTSSAPEVATVDANGLVTAIAPGTAKITVTTEQGGFTATSTVTVVEPVPVTGVSVFSNDVLHYGETEENPKNLSLGTGLQLYYKTEPEGATEQEVLWSVSDPTVLSITDYGKVAAIGSGRAHATVTTVDGSYTANFYINVPDETSPVKRISLSTGAMTVYMGEGATQLTANVYPSHATNPYVLWSSDRPEVATVDQEGNVTPVSVGYATITAKAQENEAIKAECTVSVQPVRTRVTGIRFEAPTLELGLYGVASLIPVVEPADATDKSVTWTTSNKSIVSVSRGGVVTGLNVGTATITAVTADGGYTATITVVVSSNAPQGDINNDGDVDAGDALLILRASVNLLALSDAQKSVADVNGDGEIDAGDAVLILRYDAGLIDEFPSKN